jgi:repressor LexA
MLDRVKVYIDSKEITIAAFERSIGMSNASFGKSLKSGGSIGSDKIEKILSTYKDINPEWLLTGQGEMLRVFDLSANEKGVGVPLIPIEALAGQASGQLIIHDYDIEQRYIVPEFSKADFLIRVKGSSMYPKYNPGDVLACIRMDKGKFIQWNKAYVIDSSQGIMVKRILKGADKQLWILRSDNKEYQDIDVNADEDINSISLVIGVIRLE